MVFWQIWNNGAREKEVNDDSKILGLNNQYEVAINWYKEICKRSCFEEGKLSSNLDLLTA